MIIYLKIKIYAKKKFMRHFDNIKNLGENWRWILKILLNLSVLLFYFLVIYLIKFISYLFKLFFNNNYLLRTSTELVVPFSLVLFLLSFLVKQMIAITEIIAIIGIITIRAIAPAPNVLLLFLK